MRTRAKPFRILESEYAMVFWDQRHSGMSGGPADPKDSRPEDFGEDLALVVREVRKWYAVRHLFVPGQRTAPRCAGRRIPFYVSFAAASDDPSGIVARGDGPGSDLPARSIDDTGICRLLYRALFVVPLP